MAQAPPLILIVDDDADFLAIHQHILEGAGYRTVTASSGEEALAAMAGERPDLVITDLMMRALDSGCSFARQVKEDPRLARTPVIILTSVTSQMGLDFRPRTPEDLAAMHADAYFDKPAPSQALVEKVRELLDRK
ncbi:MAG: response regulator [Planctomycetota bacterium]|nr:response regulator [Planctomycetota bacterium]